MLCITGEFFSCFRFVLLRVLSFVNPIIQAVPVPVSHQPILRWREAAPWDLPGNLNSIKLHSHSYSTLSHPPTKGKHNLPYQKLSPSPHTRISDSPSTWSRNCNHRPSSHKPSWNSATALFPPCSSSCPHQSSLWLRSWGSLFGNARISRRRFLWGGGLSL